MNNRIYRYSQIGFFFLFSTFFFYWYFGGKLPAEIYNLKTTFSVEHFPILAVIVTIFSSPIIGFMISTIIVGILSAFLVEYRPPRDEYKNEYLKIIYDCHKERSGIEIVNHNYIIKNERLLFIAHQEVLRTNEENKEILEFSTRRMDVFWTHINSIFAICTGLIIGLIIHISVNDTTYQYFAWKKSLSAIPIIAYVVLGIYHALKALKVSDDIEKIHIIKRSKATA